MARLSKSKSRGFWKTFHEQAKRDYADGMALGVDDIKNDSLLLRYKDELYEVPATEIMHEVLSRGPFYQIEIDMLRENYRAYRVK